MACCSAEHQQDQADRRRPRRLRLLCQHSTLFCRKSGQARLRGPRLSSRRSRRNRVTPPPPCIMSFPLLIGLIVTRSGKDTTAVLREDAQQSVPCPIASATGKRCPVLPLSMFIIALNPALLCSPRCLLFRSTPPRLVITSRTAWMTRAEPGKLGLMQEMRASRCRPERDRAGIGHEGVR